MIVIVDDDFLAIQQTIREIESAGINYIRIDDADTALKFVRDTSGIAFVIVDVMVGTATEGSEFDMIETNDCLTTGLALIRRWLADETVAKKLKNRLVLWSIDSVRVSDAQPLASVAQDEFEIPFWQKSRLENRDVLNNISNHLNISIRELAELYPLPGTGGYDASKERI